MKIKPYEIEKFLSAPPKTFRAFLVYGPNEGAVRLSAEKLTQTLLRERGNDDPFNLRQLSVEQCKADQGSRLAQEASNLSLGGGDVVVRVRSANDDCLQALATFLAAENTKGVVVLDSGNLTPRSKLRALAEKEKTIAACACYADDTKKITALIQERARAAGKIIEREALMTFAARLGNDRAISENEIEKLLLFMGEDKKITLDAVLAATGDRAAISLDELADCVGLGDRKNAMRHFDQLVLAGSDRSMILNHIARHFQKLHLVLSAGGGEQALSKIFPPIHFTRKDKFLAQTRLWNEAAINRALEILWQAVLEVRKGVSAPALAEQVLLSLAVRAAKVIERRRSA